MRREPVFSLIGPFQVLLLHVFFERFAHVDRDQVFALAR
jgi:hypothetical protein